MNLSTFSYLYWLFLVVHTAKDFGVVNKAEVDVFLELSSFFNDLMDDSNLISGSSAFSKSSLNIRKFMVHVLLKPSLENFEHYFASMWDEYNCVVVWTFFSIVFLWDWNENWPFPVLWSLLSFSNFLAHWVQHFNNIIFRTISVLRFNFSVYNLVQDRPFAKWWLCSDLSEKHFWS